MQRRMLSVLLLAVACSGPHDSPPSPGDDTQPEAKTIVSLSFDDTRDDQYQVGDIVAARQMRATFYVNSTRIGRDGYMSADQLHALEDAGNEIGGHTLAHVHLTELDSDAVQRDICDDRAALLALGFDVVTLAYPFGDESPGVRRIAQQCGYSAARDLGGIAFGTHCPTCMHVAPLTPVDAFAIPAVGQVGKDTTLDQLKQLVIDAENAGGGWLPIVFHHVCDGCAENAISPATLTAFVDFLAERRANGTVVKTTKEVLNAQAEPSVSGPMPALGANIVRNGSLEVARDGAMYPDCWYQRASGNNTGAMTQVATAVEGSSARQITISSYTDGSRRLMTHPECPLPVRAGHSYRVSAWYFADTAPQFAISYRTTAGVWKTLETSPPLSPSATYVQAAYVTAPLPEDAVAISVGLGISAVGSITMDNFEVIDAAAPDNTPPAVTLTSPAEGATASGVLTLAAVASDPDGIDRVDFRVNDALIEYADREPFSVQWDATRADPGVYVITARALDRDGKVATSAPVQVTVTR